jgi:hypothetical protein
MSRCGTTTRRSDATSRLISRMSADDVVVGLREHPPLDVVEALLERVDLRPVVVHERVDDAMQEPHGAIGHHERVAQREVPHVGDAAPAAVVHGHEQGRREEEVDVVRGEAVRVGLEVDAVQDDVEVAVVRLDLRVVAGLERVLDRQLVKAEDLGEHTGLGWSGLLQVGPDQHAAPGTKPGGIETIDRLGPAVPMHEVANQSPTLTFRAAWAAASRATGTR